MRYCTRCIYPDSKPDLFIDAEGICSACRNFDVRKYIDWGARLEQLRAIFDRFRSIDGSNYDCIVPSSGGKDSTFQALKVREMGMNPLIVTATTDHLTTLGCKNIENLKDLGFDYVEVTPNAKLRRRINKLALETVGDISWPEHVLIFTIPVREAVQRNIPLIVWGENSQNEYGGPAEAAESRALTRRWLEEFGGLLGMRVSDLPDLLQCSPRELLPYQYPSEEELTVQIQPSEKAKVTGIFLGQFMDWDGYANAEYAKAHGWTPYRGCVEGSACDYENLDNAQTGIHDYFKWLKYGFGRATDILCNHIRRGRLSRERALEIAKENDGRYPGSYLGVSLDFILQKIGMTRLEFENVCRKFHAHS